MSNLLELPELPALEPHVRIKGVPRARLANDLRDHYEQGVPIRALAGRVNRSYGWVVELLREAGTSLRPRGRRPRG